MLCHWITNQQQKGKHFGADLALTDRGLSVKAKPFLKKAVENSMVYSLSLTDLKGSFGGK